MLSNKADSRTKYIMLKIALDKAKGRPDVTWKLNLFFGLPNSAYQLHPFFYKNQ